MCFLFVCDTPARFVLHPRDTRNAKMFLTRAGPFCMAAQTIVEAKTDAAATKEVENKATKKAKIKEVTTGEEPPSEEEDETDMYQVPQSWCCSADFSSKECLGDRPRVRTLPENKSYLGEPPK